MRALFFAALALAAPPAPPSVPVHPPSFTDHTDPSAAFGAEGLIVTFVDRRPDAQEVVYVHSPDLEIFSAPFSVSGPIAGNEIIRPHVAANGEQAAIVWSAASAASQAGTDLDVYAAISSDGGRTFAPPVLAAGGPGGQVDPRAAVLEDGSVVIAFHDSLGSTGDTGGLVWRVRAVKGDAMGRFAPPTVIGGNAGNAFDLFAAIAGRGTPESPLAILWLREGLDRSTQILSALSSDGGASFGTPLRIDTPIGRHQRPRVAATQDGFLACFASALPSAEQGSPALAIEEADYLDVLAVSSTTAGRSFGAPVVANRTRALTQHQCDVGAKGARSAIAWIDHAKPGERRVLVRRDSDGEDLAVSERVAKSEVNHPSLAVRDDVTVIVYEDASGGAWNIRASILR